MQELQALLTSCKRIVEPSKSLEGDMGEVERRSRREVKKERCSKGYNRGRNAGFWLLLTVHIGQHVFNNSVTTAIRSSVFWLVISFFGPCMILWIAALFQRWESCPRTVCARSRVTCIVRTLDFRLCPLGSLNIPLFCECCPCLASGSYRNQREGYISWCTLPVMHT